MAELHFYTHPMSRGQMVRWMLEEVGVAYKTTIVDYGPPMKAPAYLAINPMGKVPALVHGDAVVTECGAIISYLADRFPDAGLAPKFDDPLRGTYLRWMFFTAGPIEAAQVDSAFGLQVPPGRDVAVGYGTMALVLDTLEATLTDAEYLVGDRFTAADVYLGASIGFGMMVGTIEKRAAFERYWAQLSAREALVRARAIDDALMEKHPMPGKT